MKTATRIPLVYLGISILWLALSDWLFNGAAPAGLPFLDFAHGWGFAALSALLFAGLLLQDGLRRDAVEDNLRTRAVFDPLTGLLNRSCFSENLERAIARATREESSAAVAFIDLDGFKMVNDRFGHHAGDQILVEVARRIRGVIRTADCAGRFGGDEFVVLVEGERADGAFRLGERLRDALALPIVVEGQAMGVTASVGLAMFPDHGSIGEHLLRAADKAMYRAKESGKNRAKMAQSLAA
jgi:diguanylate cyclase (GGDEF)-like protein